MQYSNTLARSHAHTFRPLTSLARCDAYLSCDGGVHLNDGTVVALPKTNQHPRWMYPGIGDVRDVYNEWLFPRLGPKTKVFVVPPTFGNTVGCNGVNDQFCVNLTLPQWEELTLGNLSFFLDWCANDSRIVGLVRKRFCEPRVRVCDLH